MLTIFFGSLRWSSVRFVSRACSRDATRGRENLCVVAGSLTAAVFDPPVYSDSDFALSGRCRVEFVLARDGAENRIFVAGIVLCFSIFCRAWNVNENRVFIWGINFFAALSVDGCLIWIVNCSCG